MKQKLPASGPERALFVWGRKVRKAANELFLLLQEGPLGLGAENTGDYSDEGFALVEALGKFLEADNEQA